MGTLRRCCVVCVLSVGVALALASLAPGPDFSEEPDPGPFPFEIVEGSPSWGSDAIGTPLIGVSIRNTGTVTLSEMNVKAEMFREGTALKEYGSGATFINFSTTDDVTPGSEHSGSWPLYGWDSATKVVLSLNNAKDVSGTSYHCSMKWNYGCQRQAVCAPGETVCEVPPLDE